MIHSQTLKSIQDRLLPARFKVLFRELLNMLYPDETIEESKRKWNQLAKKNAHYFVLTNFGENITEEQFSLSGKNDYEALIRNDEFFQRLRPFSTRRILEIGCGIGRMAEFIAQDFQETYGIDITEEMIVQARKRLLRQTNIHVEATDGLHMPFPDAFFDAVFSFIVFQHMPDRKTVRKNLEEVARVLTKGGLAKIQLRGCPSVKGTWFYGSSCTAHQVNTMIEGLPLQVLKTEGKGLKCFWVWFQKF